MKAVLEEDRRRWHVRCYVCCGTKTTTNGLASLTGGFHGIICQPDHFERLEDLLKCWDLLGLSEWWELSAFVGRVLLLLQTPAHRFFPGDISFCCSEEGLETRFWHARCCEILKYSQVYELYWSIVGQERGRTHRDLNERRKIKSNLNQINPNLV